MKMKNKTPDELQQQVVSTEALFGSRLSPRNWNGLSKYELQDNFKIRYEQYIELLRQKRSNIDQVKINEEARTLVSALNNLEDFLEGHKEGEKSILRSQRQVSVFEDLHSFLEKGEKEGYIKLPTGVGKTVIFLKLIEALGLKTLVVVPSKVLVGQTGEKIEKFTSMEFGNVFSDEKDYSKPVTITTYASLVSGVEDRSIDPIQFPVVILDEAHRSLSSKRASVINLFKGIKIGFTATPKYSQDKSIDSLLGTEIHSMELYEAIKEGLLCETHTIHVHTDIDLSGVSVTSTGEYKQDELDKAINLYSRNKAAIELYKKAFSQDKVVCYCTSVAQAKDLEILCKKENIHCAVVTGKTKPEERRQIFKKFETGEINFLLNVKVLVEGFDEPTCNVAFNLHPTLSVIDAEQRGGRPLRLNSVNPDKIGYVVDFIDRNPKNPPVLFSEILGGSAQVPETSNQSNKIRKEKKVELSKIFIEGITVDVNPESILAISNAHTEKRNKDVVLEQKDGWGTVLNFLTQYNLPLSCQANVKGVLDDLSSVGTNNCERQLEKSSGKVAIFYSPLILEQCSKRLQYFLDLEEKRQKREERNELNRQKKEEIDKMITLDTIVANFDMRKYPGLNSMRGFDLSGLIHKWVNQYVKENPDSVSNVVIQGVEYQGYSTNVVDAVAKKFDEELKKYPQGCTVADLEFDLENVEGISAHHLITILRNYDTTIVYTVKVFGYDLRVVDPVKIIKVLERFNKNNSLTKIIANIKSTLDKKMKILGYEMEDIFLPSIVLPLSRETSVLAVRKKYFELKEKKSTDFRSYKKNATDEITFIPSTISKQIELFVEELRQNEEKEIKNNF